MNIYFTPDHEQLKELCTNNPELYESIKQSLLKDIENGATKFAQNKIQNTINYRFSKIFEDLFKKHFPDYHSGKFTTSKELENKFIKLIEEKFSKSIDDEISKYLDSEEFKRALNYSLKTKLVQSVTKLLDSEIEAEAKKLIS